MRDSNQFKNMFIEYHILQSFPVTCLNRDDVGAPKSAIIGGTPRARVSSQCWKRQVRMQLHELGVTIGSRTKLISKMLADTCLQYGATDEQAIEFGEHVATLFTDKVDKGQSDTLMFISSKEAHALCSMYKNADFALDQVIDKELTKVMKANLCTAYDGLDLALFGRMVAKDSSLGVEAACSFSHAISTHKVVSEIDFFTALDDLTMNMGAAHMGSLEFNSGTYYRYVSLNLGQLYESLSGEGLDKAVEAFTKALYLAVPEARQNTQSGASLWDFARIYVRKGQRLQVPFETAVKAKDGGFLGASIDSMTEYLDKKEKLSGSLFGCIEKMDFGLDEDFSIDDVVAKLIANTKES